MIYNYFISVDSTCFENNFDVITYIYIYLLLYVSRLGYARGIPRRTKSKDDDTHSESPSPLRIGDDAAPDGGGGESSSGNTGDKSMPAPEEPPYFPEQW